MTTTDTYLIGIDGGGTSCRARITDSLGNTLGEAKSGSANVFQNTQTAWDSTYHAITQAFEQASLSTSNIQSSVVVAGLAGSEVSRCANEYLRLAQGFAHFELLNDAQIACLGAHNGEDGAVFIIGTGAIGISLHKEQWKRVGGWGFPLDDIGSGAWLGQQAVRSAIRQHDGIQPQSQLSQRIWAEFPLGSDELIEWSQHASSGDYGKFAPYVLEAFNANCENAQEILKQQIEQLSTQIRALTQPDQTLCLMGGLSDWVAAHLPGDIQKRITQSKGDALSGALSLAKRRISS